MIDHIYLPVSDLKRSSEFYKKMLEPLGIDMPYKLDQPPLRGFAISNDIFARTDQIIPPMKRGNVQRKDDNLCENRRPTASSRLPGRY